MRNRARSYTRYSRFPREHFLTVPGQARGTARARDRRTPGAPRSARSGRRGSRAPWRGRAPTRTPDVRPPVPFHSSVGPGGRRYLTRRLLAGHHHFTEITGHHWRSRPAERKPGGSPPTGSCRKVPDAGLQRPPADFANGIPLFFVSTSAAAGRGGRWWPAGGGAWSAMAPVHKPGSIAARDVDET